MSLFTLAALVTILGGGGLIGYFTGLFGWSARTYPKIKARVAVTWRTRPSAQCARLQAQVADLSTQVAQLQADNQAMDERVTATDARRAESERLCIESLSRDVSRIYRIILPPPTEEQIAEHLLMHVPDDTIRSELAEIIKRRAAGAAEPITPGEDAPLSHPAQPNTFPVGGVPPGVQLVWRRD